MKPSLLSRLLLFAALLIPTICSAYPEDMPLNISVRSEIDRPFEGWGKAAIKEHGKAYLIAAINEGRTENKLVMPVDEAALLDLLRQEVSQAPRARRGHPRPDRLRETRPLCEARVLREDLLECVRGEQPEPIAEAPKAPEMSFNRGEDSSPAKKTVVRAEEKVGRNDPCPCGSGKKYKKCHG